MGGSVAINILLSSSLSLLWGLINSLQLVTHFPLTNVKYPTNAKTYFDIMFELGNFDLIPTDSLEEILSDEIGEADHSENFDPSEKLSDATIEAGYDSTNNMQGSLLNLIMGSVVVLVVIIVVILRIFCFKVECIKAFLSKIWRFFFWNFVIRTILETYLEMSLNNMIKLYALNTETWFETLGSGFSIAILGVMAVFPIFAPIFLKKKRDVLKEPEFISKYGALMQDLRTNSRPIHYYQTFFMLRRLIFAMMIVFASRYPWAQIQVTCMLCTFQLIFVGQFAPLIFRWMRWLETTNEFLVLQNTYFLFIYSSGFILKFEPQTVDLMVKDFDFQEDVGWAHVAHLGLLIFINMVVMLVASISGMIRKIKLFFLKCKQKKQLKEL